MGLPTSSGFVLLLFFFFFHKQSPCEFCRSFNHLVPDSWSHHILQSSPPKQDKSQKEQEEPERSFTQKAGLLWCLEERLQPAPRELTRLHEACRLQWTPSKGEFLKFHLPLKTVTQNSACLQERHMCHCDPADLHVGFRSPCVRRVTGPLSQPMRSLKLMRSPCLIPNSSPGLPSLLGDYSVILWLRN